MSEASGDCSWIRCCEKAHQSGAVVHHMIDEGRGDIVALSRFNDDEVDNLESYPKRDLIDAALYLDKTDKESKDRLGFDVALIKKNSGSIFPKRQIRPRPRYIN